MKFRYLVLVLILLALGFVVQQSLRYLALAEDLRIRNEESAWFAYLIEKGMYEEEVTRQRLVQAKQHHQQLRTLLPAELQQDAFEQQVRLLAKKYQAKVLATKTAINSRPLYREANLDITLEATTTQVNRLIKELTASPRILTISPPEPLGKKNIHLTIALYALHLKAPETITLPRCIDKPGGILLPPLNEWLASRYAHYSQHCRFVTTYGESYLKQHRLRVLQDEITQLQGVIEQIG